MNEQFSDEMLSAYVDGELSAQERAEVERWLAQDPEAREKLEDFRRLSKLFGGLPRTEVPHEFPTKVLQLAERRMLLPDAVAVPTRPVAKGRRLRRWMFVLGAPLGAAAAILLIVEWQNNQQADRAPRQLARNSEPAPLAQGDRFERRMEKQEEFGAPIVANSDRRIGGGLGGGGGFAPPDQPGPGDQPSAASKSPISNPQSPDAGVKVAARKQKAVSAMAGVAAPGAPLDEAGVADPRLAVVNRVIEDYRESNEEDELLPAVTMIVADRVKGMLLIQKVFQNNDVVIESDGEAEAGKRLADKPGAEGRKTNAPGKEALYVIAEPEQLIAAFSELLAQEDPAVRLAAAPPVDVELLDAESQEQLKQITEEVANTATRRTGKATDETLESTKRAKSGEVKKSDDIKTAPGGAAPAEGAVPGGKAGAKNTAGQGQIAEKKKSVLPDKATFANKGQEPSQDGAPSDAKDAAASQKEGVANREANRYANGQSRQLIVNVAPLQTQTENRGQNYGKRSQAGSQSNNAEKPADQNVARSQARDAKSAAEEERVQQAPTLVRMLILIEPEPNSPVPAAPPASTPPEKGPQGGAS